MENKPIFLSGLNGIRTIAAFGVLISHINLSLKNFGIQNFSLFGTNAKTNSNSGWMLGEHGVTMFFVLSGFLITYLLYKEYKKTNNISIKSFYIRRLLRIWPLYYFYFFITLIVLFYFFDKTPTSSTFLYYFFYLANVPFINENALPALDHFWSIAVEEQFYLFWPILFLTFFKINKFQKIVFILIILQAIFRIFVWYKFPFTQVALFSVVNRFDCMMIGGLGAIMYLENNHFINLINNKVTQAICWVIFFLLAINKLDFFNSIIEIFLISIVTLCVIIGQINMENRLINLENKIMSYLGKLSFGIYVYHPLVILLTSFFVKDRLFIEGYFFPLFVFIWIISITIIISHLSYFYFESYFLKLKSKFSIIHSTNSKSDV